MGRFEIGQFEVNGQHDWTAAFLRPGLGVRVFASARNAPIGRREQDKTETADVHIRFGDTGRPDRCQEAHLGMGVVMRGELRRGH